MKSEPVSGKAYNDIDGKIYRVSFDRYQTCPVCKKRRRLSIDECKHVVRCGVYGKHYVLVQCDDGHARSFEEYLTGGCSAIIGVQCTVAEVQE